MGPRMFLPAFQLLLVAWSWLQCSVAAEHPHCLADPTLRAEFEVRNDAYEIPLANSCCMQDVCGLKCPEDVGPPHRGFGIAILLFVLSSLMLGVLCAWVFLDSNALQFFVAGRSLSLSVTTFTLAAQAIDANALLGNVDSSYRSSFWDGAVIPIGLASSLFLNGTFLAHKIHDDEVWTLVDVCAKRYGKTVEILVAVCSISSFIMLLAGNLVGAGRVMAYVWGIPVATGIWLSAASVWLYTYCGGLVSIAYTDVGQGLIGWTGTFVFAMYFLGSHDSQASPPSIGFPGYIYPDKIGEGGICDMYQGVECANDVSSCCYNEKLWCPGGLFNCDRMDRAAYPFGDHHVFPHQMTDSDGLAPFPNSIIYNWATIFILAFGNLGALDFQARAMAANSGRNARISCYLAGLITLTVGIPYAYLGSIVRLYYGPDSARAVFEPDSCGIQFGLPTCARWVPDELAFIKLLTHDVPGFLGGWALIGIVAASMSTADGAILAIGTTFSHNILRHLNVWFSDVITKDNLLHVARVTTLLFTLISGLVAVVYKTSTGDLLIVAFDIMLATSVVPLLACFYCKMPSPRAAFASIIAGGGTRIVLEIVLTASSAYPSFIDADSSKIWDSSVDVCQQERYEDWTGLDSVVSPLVCLVVFASVQCIERVLGISLFWFPWGEGYDKKLKQETGMAETSSEESNN